jgi:hypothetical protein
MSTETARLVAGVLARRLGIEAGEFEATLAENPLGAVVALSMMDSTRQAATPDPGSALSFVARMVGACDACLGEDAECTACQGLGKPGTRAADTDALIRWISVPLHQAGLCVGRPRSTPAANNQQGGYVR